MDGTIMQQETMITLPARENTPATGIYTKTYSLNIHLAKRDVMILIPGGPGNDHTLYTDPAHSIAEAFLPHVDTLLFDPRGCGNSESSAVEGIV
ncbi:MAG: alpha/beta hydrolase [Gammaproteobacteria bacterium]|nr:alpha/beta hydrolase [Gammaproteobacteria bacterium]